MLTLFFLYHLWMSIHNTTTNERSKRSDLRYYYEKKEEFLELWLSEKDTYTFKHREKEQYQVDEKWTKTQIEREIKKCKEFSIELDKNFYA